MTVHDLLERALKQIDHPKKFSQGELARNLRDHPKPLGAPDAAKWDAIGALDTVGLKYDGRLVEQAETALRAACKELHQTESLEEVGDKQGYLVIRKVFERAIENTSY